MWEKHNILELLFLLMFLKHVDLVFYLHCPFGCLSQDGREYSFVEAKQSIEEKNIIFCMDKQ